MIRRNCALSISLISLTLLTTLAHAAENDTGFVERKLMLGMTVSQYQIYVPAQWSMQDSWPVILYLHGSGERGNDGERQTQIGLGRILRQNPQRVPAIVAFPQCREGATWIDSDMEELALMTLERAIRNFHGDRTRVYLTGISMGGQGTWYLAMKYPNRFAALAPIAARSRPVLEKISAQEDISITWTTEQLFQTMVQKIRQIPTWAFHGRNDRVVPVDEARNMVAAMREGGNDAWYTEYASVGHDSWKDAYAEPDFFSWLFSHRIVNP